MKLPRDLTGMEFARMLQPLGYIITRQTGSHLRLTAHNTETKHITIPNHNPLKIGTLSAIVSEVADQLSVSKQQLVDRLFHH
jgi:predicted RNA binding protein YcfA (HicA-like mRNA interferase family)